MLVLFSSAVLRAAASLWVWMRGPASTLFRCSRWSYCLAFAMRALISGSVQWWLCRALRSAYLRSRNDLAGALAPVSRSEAWYVSRSRSSKRWLERNWNW